MKPVLPAPYSKWMRPSAKRVQAKFMGTGSSATSKVSVTQRKRTQSAPVAKPPIKAR